MRCQGLQQHQQFCKFSYVAIPLLTFPFGFALLFASPRAISMVYFDPINYYFDWEGFSQMKVGNHAALFLWEWPLSRDKNNHRA